MDTTDDLLTPRALVVAKDSDDVKELLAALDSWGFKTVWAKDGEAGYNVLDGRSEERRVGKECRSRWSPYH